MNQYWQNLNERERWMVILAGGTTIIYLIYLLVYSPLVTAVQNKTEQLIDKRETLQWLQQVRSQAKTEKKKTLSNSKLLTLIDQQLKSNKSLNFPHNIQQTNTGDIQLTFDRVPFNLFMQWLGELNHHYNLRIQQLQIEKLDTAGMVKLQSIISAG